ncbi:hypothetical protein HYX03_02035 [Candidatus Woesearchaeota archaeon]|nr:hypothetical protein [Candidatus Woesearchaeota archaeon]
MQRINTFPITDQTLQDFVRVVHEIHLPPKLTQLKPEGSSQFVSGKGLVTLVNGEPTNVYIIPESAMGFYDPEDPWYVPVWTEADQQHFIADITTHSQYSMNMWRGHFLNNVVAEVAELEKKGQFPQGIPQDVLRAYRASERRISGINLVY